jgi:hypothetical protein
MKRIFSIIAMLTLMALVNMGGCGGNDNETNGYKPVIDRIVFHNNSDKIKQVESYTQGSEGVVEITISDYDLNAETIEVQINQCANASCDTLTAYHTPGIYNLSQTDVSFAYTFPDMSDIIKILPATYYYQFVFEVMDSNEQSNVANKLIQINKGFPPEIFKLNIYNQNAPGEPLDEWSSYYNFIAEFKARDLDLNAKYFYINRTCLETKDPTQTKPVYKPWGPIPLLSDDTATEEITINTNTYINQYTNEINLIQKLVYPNLIEGEYEITITLEDALGNTDKISKRITIKK